MGALGADDSILGNGDDKSGIENWEAKSVEKIGKCDGDVCMRCQQFLSTSRSKKMARIQNVDAVLLWRIPV